MVGLSRICHKVLPQVGELYPGPGHQIEHGVCIKAEPAEPQWQSLSWPSVTPEWSDDILDQVAFTSPVGMLSKRSKLEDSRPWPGFSTWSLPALTST